MNQDPANQRMGQQLQMMTPGGTIKVASKMAPLVLKETPLTGKALQQAIRDKKLASEFASQIPKWRNKLPHELNMDMEAQKYKAFINNSNFNRVKNLQMEFPRLMSPENRFRAMIDIYNKVKQ